MLRKYSFVASRRFVKSWSKLNFRVKKETTEKIDLFLKNPDSPVLKTHKLSGKLKDYWSFSVSYNLWIMFRYIEGDSVEFIDIGGHEIYK